MTPTKFLVLPDLLEQAKAGIVSGDMIAMSKIDIEICSQIQSEVREGSFLGISEERKLCVSTFNAEGYVASGGFVDLFQYTEDIEMQSVIKGFEVFGATQLLTLLQKAMKKFPKSPPLPAHSVREEILNNWFDKEKDPFTKLDDKFNDIGSALRGRLEYITNHPEQFFQK